MCRPRHVFSEWDYLHTSYKSHHCQRCSEPWHTCVHLNHLGNYFGSCTPEKQEHSIFNMKRQASIFTFGRSRNTKKWYSGWCKGLFSLRSGHTRNKVALSNSGAGSQQPARIFYTVMHTIRPSGLETWSFVSHQLCLVEVGCLGHSIANQLPPVAASPLYWIPL